jgi:tetratricopeptide (TPR) repeat protein
MLNQMPPDPRMKQAFNQAAALAPEHFDIWYFAMQHIPLDRAGLDGGIAFAERMTEVAPDVAKTWWLLASFYHRSRKDDLAAEKAYQALLLGYEAKFNELAWLLKYHQNRREYNKVYELYGAAQFRWRINYFADKKDYRNVVDLYRKAVQSNPYNYGLYQRLAAAYFEVGEKDNATAAAQKAVLLHPAEANQLRRWLRMW